MRRIDSASRLGVALLAGAIVVAPFIALLVRAEAGLIVMGVALGATSMLLREVLGAMPLKVRRGLRALLGANLVLAIVCVALAVWLLVRS